MHIPDIDAAFIAPMMDLVPDAIIWVHPVKDEAGNITDFEVGFSNKAADEAIQHPKGGLAGLHIRKDGVPSEPSAENNFQHFLDVYTSGETKEYLFVAHHSNRSFETIRKPYAGGIISITRDRRAQREAERKEKEKTELLNGIVRHSPIGLEVYEAVRNESGEIIDFRIQLCNEVVHSLTGVSCADRFRLSFREVLAAAGVSHYFEKYKHTVDTGEPFSFEFFATHIEKWLNLEVVKLGDGFLITLADITALKASEKALQQQTSFLNGILNSSLSAVFACEAVRNEAGEIVDLRYTLVNKVYQQFVGKIAEEVIGKTMLELYPNAKPTGAFDTHCKVIETGQPARFEVRYKGDGLNAWFDTASVKMGADGVVVTFADVREQREAAAAMEQQKNLLHSILANSSNGISVSEVMRDENRKVVNARTILANDAALRFAGLSREDMLTKTATDIDPNILESDYYRAYVHTLDTGEPALIQYYIEFSRRWLELSISRLDADHIIHIFTDVTPIKEAQLRLEETVADLQRSNASLEEFAYAASHDLQEPLRKILTFSERIKVQLSGVLSEQQLLMFERIEAATERMKRLIEDLLAYSRASAMMEGRKEVCLNEVVNGVMQDFETTIADTSARIQVQHLPVVRGDEVQLRQVFHNLVGNALKYRKQEMPPEIEISSRRALPAELQQWSEAPNSKWHVIEIKDNGIGFEQQYADKIFQVFQRLHGKAEYEGTGVGLAIVEKVVRNHKGRILAEGKPGAGATFTILLPVNGNGSNMEKAVS